MVMTTKLKLEGRPVSAPVYLLQATELPSDPIVGAICKQGCARR